MPLRSYICKMTRTAIREERENRPGRGHVTYVKDVASLLPAGDKTGSEISLEDCLGWLSNRSEREAVRLRIAEGLKIEEIAQRLGVSIGTGHKRLKDGLGKIGKKLSESLERPLPESSKGEK